ncbi:MAG: VOC family protein [Dehalococcoidia bacterium]|jgi:catechol 2,3-dioxygenase-like lactoylglutathione lyase family enzyme|nr:VOC family protein [Dehalococcoidia bacterium]
MIATCVTHVGICVRDMAESLKFYRDALGMKVVGEKITDITEGGTQTARLDNYAEERNTRHWVSLAYGDGLTPTLTLTSHPGEKPSGEPILLDQVGISHISFGVADVAGLADELEAKGFRLAGSKESFTNANGEIRSIYVRDPDGILVQFNNP